MTKKPINITSGRAARRREEHEVAKAQRTVARAQGQPRPLPAQEGGMRVSVNDLLIKIGALTMERDVLQLQLTQQQAQREKLVPALSSEEGESGTAEESAEEEEPDVSKEEPAE